MTLYTGDMDNTFTRAPALNYPDYLSGEILTDPLLLGLDDPTSVRPGSLKSTLRPTLLRV